MDIKKSTEQGLPPPVKKVLKKFNFEADPELVDMIQEIKNLLSHSCPERDMASLLKKALPLAICEIKIKKDFIKRSEVKASDRKSVEVKKSPVSNLKSRLQFEGDLYKQNIFIQDHIKSPGRGLEELEAWPYNLQSTEGELKKSSTIKPLKNKQSTSLMKQQGMENHSFFQPPQKKSEYQKCEYPKRKITRAIPVELKRKVWKRDGGCCQYKDPQTGKQCQSTYQLELEHVRPWSLGGGHSLENLMIMCKSHNLYRWDSRMNKTE